eukprot:1576801-Prorocentrum_lima.AAC.1
MASMGQRSPPSWLRIWATSVLRPTLRFQPWLARCPLKRGRRPSLKCGTALLEGTGWGQPAVAGTC